MQIHGMDIDVHDGQASAGTNRTQDDIQERWEPVAVDAHAKQAHRWRDYVRSAAEFHRPRVHRRRRDVLNFP